MTHTLKQWGWSGPAGEWIFKQTVHAYVFRAKA